MSGNYALRRVQRWLRAALAAGLGEALWLFITLRFAFSLFALLLGGLGQIHGVLDQINDGCTPDVQFATQHSTGSGFLFLGVWERWDACWYERVAAQGYQQGEATINFYPLYPLLMRLISIPLGGDLTLGGLVVSGVAYIAGVAGLYRLLRLDFDEGVARRALLYLSVFPASFFFFAPFTESIFLALGVWAIYQARRGAWGWAVPVAFLVGLTRTQVFCLRRRWPGNSGGSGAPDGAHGVQHSSYLCRSAVSSASWPSRRSL